MTEDKKRSGYKVSAKEVLTRQDLKMFHTDLERHLDTNDRNCHFNVINEATKDGNKEIAELKKQTAHVEVQQATQKATEALKGTAVKVKSMEVERDRAEKRTSSAE